jgi:glycosyltransferase involved in cell wall biosynthesis
MITDAPPRIPFLGNTWIRSRLTFPFSSAVVANSYAGLNRYKAPRKKGICIYNGFNWNRVRYLMPSDVIKSRFLIETSMVVGMVGEFARRKDFPMFITAATLVLNDREDVTFLAVGDGEELDRCKAMVPEALKGRIRFLGWQEDVESIINIFDVAVLASFNEGFSNAILEYMALGKPVVATRGGGTDEVVEQGSTGILVEQGDPARLASAIQELLSNVAQARTMGINAQSRVKAQFSIETMVRTYLNLYATVLSSGTPPIPEAGRRSIS